MADKAWKYKASILLYESELGKTYRKFHGKIEAKSKKEAKSLASKAAVKKLIKAIGPIWPWGDDLSPGSTVTVERI